RARAGTRNVVKEVRFGVRLCLAHDYGRAGIGVAELYAVHLMTATLCDVGQPAEIGARRRAWWASRQSAKSPGPRQQTLTLRHSAFRRRAVRPRRTPSGQARPIRGL